MNITLRLLRAAVLPLSLTAFAAFAQTNSITVNIPTNPTIVIGVQTEIPFTLSGGSPPYQINLTNPAALPPGLMFSLADSAIEGTPTQLGSFTFSITVTDSQGNFGGAGITITVAPPVSITTGTTLPVAVVGQPYAFQLVSAGGAPPYTWVLVSGALPPGFRMDTRGIVGGVASGSGGSYTFAAKVTDNQGTTAMMTFSIQVQTPPPVITVDRVVNGASFVAGLAPGAYGSIFGSNLATAAAPAPSAVPFPTTLGGVTVTINGAAVPLLAVTPTQINFQVPFATAPGAASLVVTSQGVSAPSAQVTILQSAPGIFQTAAGHALALNQNGTVNMTGQGVRSGDIVVLFATGAGAFDSTLQTGGASPTTTLLRITPLPTVTVAGRAAEVVFAGAAPGQGSGVVQMNVRVPAGLAAGDYPVSMTMNGQTSNAPVITVVN